MHVAQRSICIRNDFYFTIIILFEGDASSSVTTPREKDVPLEYVLFEGDASSSVTTPREKDVPLEYVYVSILYLTTVCR